MIEPARQMVKRMAFPGNNFDSSEIIHIFCALEPVLEEVITHNWEQYRPRQVPCGMPPIKFRDGDVADPILTS